MLSVVVVGRNDSHGYNLNKRVASSLNVISSLLDDDDELIFVDWNTPITLPAMPVSIQSDLTSECKAKLKVVRVPPKIHNIVNNGSDKQLLEPIARNVGIRLANPENPWVLSTNTDIIFLANGFKFKDLLLNLERKLWTTFRYELPEFLWESLDSRNPTEISKMVALWDREFDLRRKYFSTPDGSQVHMIPDAVGDFQLAPKDLWHAISGFPEEMLDGWHVDTRASIAFERLTHKSAGIIRNLTIYHQNHLRTLTAYHESHTNDPNLALVKYKNNQDWGLVNFNLVKENFVDLAKIDKALAHLKVLDFEPVNFENSLVDIEKSKTYDLSHVAPYLADIFVNLPESQNILLLSQNIQTIGYVESFLVSKHSLYIGKDLRSIENQIFDLVLVDFGVNGKFSYQKEFFSDLIRNFIPLIQSWENHSTIFVFIRVQNWGIRTFVRQYFSVPLFNNYTQLLVGTRKTKVKNTFRRYSVSLLAYFGAVSDYELDFQNHEKIGALKPFRARFFVALWKIYRSLPIKIRGFIRRFIL